MKKVVAVMLVLCICICMCFCACHGKDRKPTGHGKVELNIINKTDGVYTLSVDWVLKGETIGTTAVEMARSGEKLDKETLCFALTDEDVPLDTDLSTLAAEIKVTESDGDISSVLISIPSSWGDMYEYEFIADNNGKYYLEKDGVRTALVKETEETALEFDFFGPWSLDGDLNDFNLITDKFPGYMEWDASMEIKSNGLMSFYIGAEGWSGNYNYENNVIHAELGSELQMLVLPWVFPVYEKDGKVILEMTNSDMTIYWVYGDEPLTDEMKEILSGPYTNCWKPADERNAE